MAVSANKVRRGASREVSPVVYTDDGGSGLLKACKERFISPAYEVTCDARHTVWVKRVDGSRSYGLPPWIVREHPMNDVLDSVERKLK